MKITPKFQVRPQHYISSKGRELERRFSGQDSLIILLTVVVPKPLPLPLKQGSFSFFSPPSCEIADSPHTLVSSPIHKMARKEEAGASSPGPTGEHARSGKHGLCFSLLSLWLVIKKLLAVLTKCFCAVLWCFVLCS